MEATKSIRPIDHCLLCDNMILESGKGPVCGLTAEKPKFSGKCQDKKFDETLKQRLIEAIQNYETMKNSKGEVMLSFWSYLILSILVTGGAVALYLFLWESGWFSAIPFVIGAAGIALLGYAFGPLNNYRSKMTVYGQKLRKYEDILNLYATRFEYEVEIVKDYQANPQKQAKCRNLVLID